MAVPFYHPPLRDAWDGERMRGDLNTSLCTAVRVLAEEEVAHHRSKFEEVMRKVRPDCKEGEAAPTPMGARGCSFVNAYGMGQHEDVWKLRLNPFLRGVMASIYGVEPSEMGVSADNLFYWGMDGKREKAPDESKLKGPDAVKAVTEAIGSTLRLHKDLGVNTHGSRFEEELKQQQSSGTGRIAFTHSLQAQVPLLDVTPTSAGLVLVKGDMDFDAATNKAYFSNLDQDFCCATPEGYAAFRSGLVKVCVPAGCAIIWRSDRVHANCKAAFGSDPRRLGLFVTWHPRRCAPGGEYNRKRKFAKIMAGETSTHWPFEVEKRWKKPGSHMSNKGGVTKQLTPCFSQEMRDRIFEAV